MKTFVAKIGQLRQVIEKQRGEFVLFALVLPEESITWDMLVAAKWIDVDESNALKYLVSEVQNVLTKKELLELSGILIFDTNNIGEITSSVDSEMGWEENNIDFYGRQVQKAYIFAAPAYDFHISRTA